MFKNHLILLILCLIVAQAKGQEARINQNPRQDAAIWAYYEFEKKITKNWWLHYKNQYRFNENISRWDYTFFDVGVDHRAAKWLDVSGAYVFNLKNHWRRGLLFRHQLYANATFKYRVGDFRFSSRNQIQTNIEDVFTREELDVQTAFYRNKLMVRWYIDKKWRIQASGEAYFRLGVRRPWEDPVFRQRYILGLSHKFNKRDQIEVYYLFQRQIRQRRPDYIYVIGLGYSRSFRF